MNRSVMAVAALVEEGLALDTAQWSATRMQVGGYEMDPITLILTALVAGAALGLKDTASAAVKDAYTALKALVKRRFGGRPDAELVLAQHERVPDIWQAPLRAELAEAGADSDPDLVAAAQAVMRLVDPVGVRAGKYTVDVRGAQGVQIGDHNRQDNIFNAPRATETTGYDRPRGGGGGWAGRADQ